jgi:hypothetical protein
VVLDLQEQLKKKNEDLAAMKSRYNNVVFVFVFGLVAGKVLFQ